MSSINVLKKIECWASPNGQAELIKDFKIEISQNESIASYEEDSLTFNIYDSDRDNVIETSYFDYLERKLGKEVSRIIEFIDNYFLQLDLKTKRIYADNLIGILLQITNSEFENEAVRDVFIKASDKIRAFLGLRLDLPLASRQTSIFSPLYGSSKYHEAYTFAFENNIIDESQVPEETFNNVLLNGTKSQEIKFSCSTQLAVAFLEAISPWFSHLKAKVIEDSGQFISKRGRPIKVSNYDYAKSQLRKKGTLPVESLDDLQNKIDS